MLLIVVLTTGFSYAQEAPEGGLNGAVDETSLILFPEEDQSTIENDLQEPAAPSSVGVADLVRVIIVLAGVVALIYLLVYFLKKFSPLAETEEEQIGILATRHLKKDSSLHIIEVGNQVFLIGSGSNNISLISEITDQETLDKLHLETGTPSSSKPFSFRNLLGSFQTGGPDKGVTEGSPDFLRQQRERLRHLREEE